MRSQFGHKPQVFKPTNIQKAVYYNSNRGPSWGNGCTLRIISESNRDAYSKPTGLYEVKGNMLLGGTSYNEKNQQYNYLLAEYEVYQVVVWYNKINLINTNTICQK